MALFLKLRQEYSQPADGEYLPYYYKYDGYIKTLGEKSLAKCRTSAVNSLFDTPKPPYL